MMNFTTLLGICLVVLTVSAQPVSAVRPKRCPYDGAIKCTSKCSLGKNFKGCDICVCPTTTTTSPCPSKGTLNCDKGCPIGFDVNGCETCICLPPKDSQCPPLTKCREGCTVGLTSYSSGCPQCLKCPDTPGHCPTFKCGAGSILGNPDELGCDVCIPPPASSSAEHASRRRRYDRYESNGRPPPCGGFVVCSPECHYEQDPKQSCPTCVCDKVNRGSY